MVGRIGFGPDVDRIAKVFHFPLAFSPDVFHLSTSKGVDILISDIDDPKIADKIPRWFRDKVGARSFVLFPIQMKGVSVGMIYCDKDQAGAIQLSEHELQLFKALRDQALQGLRRIHE
ncbi:MAG TPA: GAF domain-containing protein, partial [Rhodocyclaceae bacterium]|nr:GAF domain-containing protein [Rhodocyclaceae bacterium]